MLPGTQLRKPPEGGERRRLASFPRQIFALRTGLGIRWRLGRYLQILAGAWMLLRTRRQWRHLLHYLRSRHRGYLLEAASPWLTFDAINFLKEYLRPGMRVFEYGSGGSTLFWLRGGAECVSVEHDPSWFAVIRQRTMSSGTPDLRLVPPELSATTSSPVDPSDPDSYASDCIEFHGHRFHRYVTQIDSFPDEYFDVVLVDGRARPSCIKHGVPKVKIGGLLIVDNADRPYYFARTGAYLRDFETKEFVGFGPVNHYRWETRVYIRFREPTGGHV